MGVKFRTCKRGLGLLSLLFLAPMIDAHSWVEQLMVIAPNGTFVGSPGYSRGNILRTDPQYNDPQMVYLVPADINKLKPDAYLCKDIQRKQTQTDGSPRLQANAGAAIALRYQENGHVTLPDQTPHKPLNRGTVYVYGTTEPKEGEKIMDVHKVWNKEGSGGDKRGVLLSMQDYDDSRCYQVNNGSISQARQGHFPHKPDPLMGVNLWCQSDIALPSNAPSGKPYTLYWVWDWPTSPNAKAPEGKQEVYTTCIDVDVVANLGTQSHGPASYIDDKELLNIAAIPARVAEIFGSGTSSGSAHSSPIVGTSKAPSGSGSAVPSSSTLRVSSSIVATLKSGINVPMTSHGGATVTSFVTTTKTVSPGCSGNAIPK
ncbi:hypothetical protein BDV28DRAFT_139532 [Aspergillus coremiiformis]|uniref:DUF7492 domain-containing protein n=1 Tax=Aspergillus coremiiformis TaxID=138285 RepID=A0A5N6YZ55_9EURO|nr:hypothetical protein BDV28DRAFT_139532 [Aspergillus coremiiformis]